MPDKYDDIIRTARERYKSESDNDRKERLEASDDLKFEANEDDYQWPSHIKNSRTQDNPPRPCLSINKIPEKIDLVEGEFRQLKPSFKVRGIDSAADPRIAEIFSGLIRRIEYSSSARSVYNFSHSSVLKCGRGAWKVGVEDDEDDSFVRNITINRIPNVLSVYWDSSAKKPDKSDANYWFITDILTEGEFKETYPDADITPFSPNDGIQREWRTERTVMVAEYWWKEQYDETFYRVERNNAIMTVKEDEIEQDDRIIADKTVKSYKVRYGIIDCYKFLEGPFDWPTKQIPIVLETGKETNIDGQCKYRGMVRHAKSPQQMYNFWSSATTEQIALAPKSPYLATARMISKYQPQWDSANTKNYVYLLYDADPQMGNARPQREPPPQLSTALASELARMEHDIMSAMGIYQATLGDTGPERSGRAITARQRQGSIGSYIFTDNFEMAYIWSLKIIINLIPHVYDTERVIRILGDQDEEIPVPINMRQASPQLQSLPPESMNYISLPKERITNYINDFSVGKYDIMASIGPSYSTQREELAAVLGEIIKSMPPQYGVPLIETFIEALDLPSRDKILAQIRQASQSASQPSTQDQIDMKRLELDGLKEMRSMFDSKIDAIAKLMTAESKERGQQLSEITAFVEQLRARAEMEQQNKQQQ